MWTEHSFCQWISLNFSWWILLVSISEEYFNQLGITVCVSSIEMDKIRGVFKYQTFENRKNSGKSSDQNGTVHRFKSFMSDYIYPTGKETRKGKWSNANDDMLYI